jgi:hypothetical protein
VPILAHALAEARNNITSALKARAYINGLVTSVSFIQLFPVILAARRLASAFTPAPLIYIADDALRRIAPRFRRGEVSPALNALRSPQPNHQD